MSLKRAMLSTLLFASMMGLTDNSPNKIKVDWLDSINIDAEYLLIQQKKSKLSSQRRRIVERVFLDRKRKKEVVNG